MKKLPTIKSPLFELTVPSTGKKVKYRPFTVKEEKILLIANESDDPEQAILAVKQVVSNCFTGVNIDELAMFDLEYLLLELRSKSVDNTVSFSINDPSGEKISLTLDLDNIKLIKEDDHTNKIVLDEEYALLMRYPTINEFTLLMKNPTDKEINFKIMVACMDTLASTDGSVYKLKDYNEEELNGFIDSLGAEAIKQIRNFFATMPRLRHEMKYKLSTGEEKIFVIEGMQTFFL